MRFMPMSESELTLDLFYAPDPSALDYYQVWLAPGIGAMIRQNWCRVEVSWEQGKAGRPAVRLQRKVPRRGIDIHGHTQLRFFGAIASNVILRLTINDQTYELHGHDDPGQYALPIVGEHIHELAFEYVPQAPGIGAATLMWLALVDPERDAQRLRSRGYYEESWEGFLLPKGQEEEPRVEIGLLFSQEDLADLRAKAASPLYKPWMEALRKQARAMLKVCPESLIGDIPLVIIFGPRELGKVEQLMPEFAVLEGTGQALVCREMPGLGSVRLQVVGGPVARLTVGGSHSHEDRGNILLEAGGEELLIDRGIGGYSSALGLLLKRPAAHNLLVPDRPDGSPAYQDLGYQSDISPQASYAHNIFRAVIETGAAWPAPVVRSRRTVLSAEAGTFEIVDELELAQPLGATLHMHTPCQARPALPLRQPRRDAAD